MNNQKVLLVNGSLHEKGCTYTVLTEIASVLRAEGMNADLFWIGQSRFRVVSTVAGAEKKAAVYSRIVSMIFWRLPETMTDLSSVPRSTMPEPLAH